MINLTFSAPVISSSKRVHPMAATFSGFTLISGIKSLSIDATYSKLPFYTSTVIDSKRKPNFKIQHLDQWCSWQKSYKLSVGRNYQLSYNDESCKEPFLLNQTREAIVRVGSLARFLVEQPSQLKYIEWPSFQSTLKTATLTLMLVAFLIVVLSSVDSALSYLLALLLRRKA